MTQPELLELLKELHMTGSIVHVHVSVNISDDRQNVSPPDDGSPIAPTEQPDFYPAYYGLKR